MASGEGRAAAFVRGVPFAALCGGAIWCVAVDAYLDRHEPPVPVMAALDWSAHHVWTVLALRALPPRLLGDAAAPALATSIALDVDHLPIAAKMLRGQLDLPRPRPHTFLTPLALAAAGRRSRRTRFAAFGIAVHLTRDLFNGPGVDAAWPLRSGHVRLPTAAEAVVLTGLLALARSRSSALAPQG
ncbi:MAG TPA: hypothetical protein VN238_09515 [Solirubrobacteraceae bacterium]|nr:hypothetical protein [Solirubrobacteraceae bacterium]